MSNTWANLRAKHDSNKTSMISKQEFKSWKYLEITSEWKLWENGHRTIVSYGTARVSLIFFCSSSTVRAECRSSSCATKSLCAVMSSLVWGDGCPKRADVSLYVLPDCPCSLPGMHCPPSAWTMITMTMNNDYNDHEQCQQCTTMYYNNYKRKFVMWHMQPHCGFFFFL